MSTYATINTFVERTTSCSTIFPSILIFSTALGCRYCFSSFFTDLSRIKTRDTLIPPPVLPARIDKHQRSTIIVLEKLRPFIKIHRGVTGRRDNRTDLECRILGMPAVHLPQSDTVLTVMMPTADAMIRKYTRTSCILKGLSYFSHQRGEVKVKIHSEQNHKAPSRHFFPEMPCSSRRLSFRIAKPPRTCCSDRDRDRVEIGIFPKVRIRSLEDRHFPGKSGITASPSSGPSERDGSRSVLGSPPSSNSYGNRPPSAGHSEGIQNAHTANPVRKTPPE